LKGDLFNSCPSKFEVGEYTFGNIIDAFVRFNKYSFDGEGNVIFSTKLVDDTYFYK